MSRAARTVAAALLLGIGVAYDAKPEDDRSFPGAHSCAADEALATFGAGCFWSVELAFQRLHGVVQTQVGYMGGAVDRPSYEQVYTGETGHVEVVQLVYRPADISFSQLLEAFETKLPTSSNHHTVGSHLTFDQLVAKPNPKDDHGTQYRSVIFTHDEAQHDEAEAWKARAMEARGASIVTAIEPATTFWPAEAYHQQFLEKGGQDASKGSEEPIKCYG